MRNFAIATVLMLASTGAYACCSGQDFTRNYDVAGAHGGGFAANKAISFSASRGNGYADNRATSGSYVSVDGYGVDRAYGGGNGYQAGVHVVTRTHATALSNNRDNATGFALGGAVALGGGSAGGYANSDTFDWTCWDWYGRPYGRGQHKSEATSFGGGMVGAGSASLALTGGPNTRTRADNYAGASAGIDISGRAETEGDSFWATYGDRKYANSYSDSMREGTGPAINGGLSGSFAVGGGVAWGRGGDHLFN